MFGGLAGAGGQSFDLAFPQPDAYTGNSANDFHEFPGGSLRRLRVVVELTLSINERQPSELQPFFMHST
jgi:hypothetical protein